MDVTTSMSARASTLLSGILPERMPSIIISPKQDSSSPSWRLSEQWMNTLRIGSPPDSGK